MRFVTQPFIFPSAMSALADHTSCPPPRFRNHESWNGFTQTPVSGFGLHTVGTPSFIGIPSAPGNVPKNESNERFSCMTMMTCLIFCRASARTSIVGLGVGRTDDEGEPEREPVAETGGG